MKITPFQRATAIGMTLLCLPTGLLLAGTEVESAADKKIVAPPEIPDPVGMATLGGKVSSEVSTVFLDSILPLWSPGESLFFLDTRTTYNSDDQLLSSYGLGARFMLPDQNVILGGNVFYDSIHSRAGNDFDELGLGAEVLTKWVDARFNYYLPEDSRYEISRHSNHGSDNDVTPVFRNRITRNTILLQQQKNDQDRRSTTKRYEYALEGWNAEIGFLVPGLDRYMETRVFAGAYGYGNFAGFKGRVEARPLPGVIANVEYWEDRALMGGHWTGELAVSVPFSLFNLAKGRNPFEGFTDSFRPRQREFRERMSDMIVRSHVVMTNSTATTTTTSNSNSQTVTEGTITLKPQVKKAAAAPPPPPPDGPPPA